MKKVVDEIVLKFESFAIFDTVQDFSDHHYGKKKSAAMQVSMSPDAYLYRVINFCNFICSSVL